MRLAPSAVLLLIPLCSAACRLLPQDPPEPYAWVHYDPANGDIPLPNDAVRDADRGQLALPTDDPNLTEADLELRAYLNALDGWSTASTITVRFSEPMDAETVTQHTVQVWEWGMDPVNVEGLEWEFDSTATELSIHAPLDGWKRSGQYAVAIVGGDGGLSTLTDLPLGPDAAFSYLILDEPLDAFEHQRAFPGATRAERLDSATALEAIRLDLQPVFSFLEDDVEPDQRVPRDELAALFRFTVTSTIELAMDRPSQRMPLPFNLLIDPTTGFVDLPPSDRDSDLEADAKQQANRLEGFSVSANLMFDLTGPADPSTVNSETVQLIDLSVTPEVVPITVTLMGEAGAAACQETPVPQDCKHLVVALEDSALPLKSASTYALVVSNELRGSEGETIVPMSIGHFMTSTAPLAQAETSLLNGLSNEDAVRIEWVRQQLVDYLDNRGREDLITAWPFTTLDPLPRLQQDSNTAEQLGLSNPPTVASRKPAYSLFEDDALSELFPGLLNPAPAIYWPRTIGVEEVVQGTIESPIFLDAETRRWRGDGGYEVEEIPYMAIVPEDVSGPMPVVIFGHAIVSDRRFLLTIAGELAQRGFASIAIDFPYHGDRTVCVDASLVAVPNFFPEELRPVVGFEEDLIWLPPCVSGDDASCSPTGECLDKNGNVEPFNTFPIIDLKPASGAAFMDISDIAYISDHFHQALVDLGALKHSLQTEDWSGVFGREIQTDRFWYAGQSMGSIIGFIWVATNDDIERAVFNVPGSNLVDLFRESTYFAPQVDSVLDEQELEEGSYDAERLFNIASWLVDPIDPHTVARLHRDSDRVELIQMDKINDSLGDIIIPNTTTENLARVSEIPILAYPSVLHADLIVPGVGEPMLSDLTRFLAGELNP